MTEYRKEIARIEKTFLGIEDHGIFTAVLHVSYGGAHQGIGTHSIKRVAGRYIPAMLKVCHVDSWEQLRGRTIYVLFGPEDKSYYRPLGIESLPFDGSDQMIFDDIFAANDTGNALKRLVELKDGPRDAVYETNKESAWQDARDALAEAGL